MLKQALARFTQMSEKNELSKIYKQIQGGTCSSCGSCCYDNVGLSACEFMNVLLYLQEENRIEETKLAIEKWYLNQYTQVQACIFLKENLCSIYEVRPLTCRLFGHQEIEEQNYRVGLVLKQNTEDKEILSKEYGIEVSDEVLHHAIRQCDFIPNKRLSKEERSKIFDEIQQRDKDYYLSELIDEELINLSLIEWFIALYFDEEILFDTLMSEISKRPE
jgi:Fe-S-cluster containining protein